MNKKFIGTVLVVFALIFSVLTVEAYAGEYKKMKGHRWNLEEKFSKKALFFLKNQEELGLSDEQIEKIKNLKIKIKKDIIGKDAELEIVSLDLQSGLWKEKIDTIVLNELIDKKYDLKKGKAKFLVEAYAALKDILTEEQKENMKSVWMKCKKEMKKGSKKK